MHLRDKNPIKTSCGHAADVRVCQERKMIANQMPSDILSANALRCHEPTTVS